MASGTDYMGMAVWELIGALEGLDLMVGMPPEAIALELENDNDEKAARAQKT